MVKSTPDQIERSLIIPAPRERVWEALTDPKQFGEWFHVDLNGDTFEPGVTVRGKVKEKDHENLPIEMTIGQIEENKIFTWRWHPAAIDPQADYSRESTTHVEFMLEEAPGGTRLSLVESGFDQLPSERRDAAYRMNYDGWGIQLSRIDDYVTRKARTG